MGSPDVRTYHHRKVHALVDPCQLRMQLIHRLREEKGHVVYSAVNNNILATEVRLHHVTITTRRLPATAFGCTELLRQAAHMQRPSVQRYQH